MTILLLFIKNGLGVLKNNKKKKKKKKKVGYFAIRDHKGYIFDWKNLKPPQQWSRFVVFTQVTLN